jgi:hypothetical protein
MLLVCTLHWLQTLRNIDQVPAVVAQLKTHMMREELQM